MRAERTKGNSGPPPRRALKEPVLSRISFLFLFLTAAAPGLVGCKDELLNSGANPDLVFGRTGLGHGEFAYPRAAVAAPGNRLYVVDKAARVQCFTQDGKYLCDWEMPESSAGKPVGLGVGPDGRLYVADTHYARVMIYEPDGQWIGSFGSFGTEPGQFKLPRDVAIDRNGFIYVSEDGGNDRISKFAPDHRYLFSFGGPGSGAAALERPQSLEIAPDGTLWVADACHHRICRFDADGKFLGAFGKLGSGPGELNFPYNAAFLSDGTLVVCEFGNQRIQRFDAQGRSLGVWGAPGRRPGQLSSPWGLAIGEKDRIFVVDSGNNRIQALDGLASGTWRR